MKIGGHQSIAGGHKNALTSISEIGGNCLQIFSSSPRQWSLPSITEDQITEFRKLKEKLQIDPIYFHASYLINLATPLEFGEQSVKSLITDLSLAAKMSIKGAVVHLGTFGLKKDLAGFHTLLANMRYVLDNTPESTLLIIENAGSRKIGTTLDEIGEIIHQLENPRVKVCLDTCHLYVAGYQFSTMKELDHLLEEFDIKIGLQHLELFHLNDSKTPFKSHRDVHANIGQGTMGEETFRTFLNHPLTQNYPFILEVPGYDDKGPDKKNIEVVKGLRTKIII